MQDLLAVAAWLLPQLREPVAVSNNFGALNWF